MTSRTSTSTLRTKGTNYPLRIAMIFRACLVCLSDNSTVTSCPRKVFTMLVWRVPSAPRRSKRTSRPKRLCNLSGTAFEQFRAVVARRVFGMKVEYENGEVYDTKRSSLAKKPTWDLFSALSSKRTTNCPRPTLHASTRAAPCSRGTTCETRTAIGLFSRSLVHHQLPWKPPAARMPMACVPATLPSSATLSKRIRKLCCRALRPGYAFHGTNGRKIGQVCRTLCVRLSSLSTVIPIAAATGSSIAQASSRALALRSCDLGAPAFGTRSYACSWSCT